MIFQSAFLLQMISCILHVPWMTPSSKQSLAAGMDGTARGCEQQETGSRPFSLDADIAGRIVSCLLLNFRRVSAYKSLDLGVVTPKLYIWLPEGWDGRTGGVSEARGDVEEKPQSSSIPSCQYKIEKRVWAEGVPRTSSAAARVGK